MTGQLTDAVFSLTAGDPGPCPLPPEPPCSCDCALQPVDAAIEEGFWATPGVTPPRPASPLLTDLRQSLDRLAEAGPLSGSRSDTAALFELAERARALALRELAEMDAVGGHAVPGAPTTAASWLRDTRHVTDAAARSTVSLAIALRDELPLLGETLTAGSITVEHAQAVTAGVRGLDRDMVREAEPALCALARTTDPVDVRKRLRDKAAAIDDRIAAEAERRARDRRGLRVNDVGAHTAVDGSLPAEEGARLQLAMALATEAAREAGDTRGKAARQADVLVAWADDYLARHHGAGDSVADDLHTVRTHLHVVATPEQLAAAQPALAAQTPTHPTPASLNDLLLDDLAGAPPAAPYIAGSETPLSRASLRRLACDATVDLVVLTPGTADPLYVGRAARIVSACQWRALVVRDRRCVVTGCRRPPAQCVAHHAHHWADGGLTDLDNLVLLCHQHHHDHHDRGMRLPHRDGTRWLTEAGWAHAPP